MPTYWTLENAGVEKTFKDWGIDDADASFVNQGEDEVVLSANGRKMDAAYLFAYKSTVIIRRDRVSATGAQNSFSGGTPYFTGLCVHPHVGASGRREFQACSIVGPWWYLNERGFEQEYKEVESVTNGVPTFKSPNPTKSRIFLNLKLGTYGETTIEKLTTGQQLTEALTWCLKPFVDTSTAPPFQIGTIGLAVDPAVDEVKNITCAEAVRKMLRWSPDAVAWFDHTTEPPTFNVKRRAALSAYNLQLAVTKPTDIHFRPRFDLQRPFVRIQYEIDNTFDGQSYPAQLEDVWPNPPPTGALNQFGGVPFVINLRGYTAFSGNSVSIKTTPILQNDVNWWLQNEPEYKAAKDSVPPRVITFELIAGSVEIKTEDGEDNLNLPNQLIAGQPSDAINAQFQRLTATCKARVVYANGGELPDKTFSFQFTSTDAVTGTFGSGGSITPGDPVPVNLARDFYEALSVTPYEGTVSFRTAELGGLPKLGEKFNVTDSANADWATMNTLVQRVTENIHRRTTVVEFGTPPHLDLADLVALLRVTRNRDPQNPYSIRVGSGAGTGSGGGLRAHTARQNSSNAAGNWKKVVASGAPIVGSAPNADKGVIQLDAGNKQITGVGAVGDGSFIMKTAPDEGTWGQLVQFSWTKGCDPVTGAPRYCVVMRSPWVENLPPGANADL